MFDQMLTIKETHQKLPGLSRPYRFLHITDLHISFSDETADPKRIEHAAWRTEYFSINGIVAAQRFEALQQYIIDHQDELDGVLFTGDIIDAPCDANITFLEKWFAELPEDLRSSIIENWGEPVGEGMVHNGKLLVTGVQFGNTIVCAQHKRGCE